MRKVLSVFLSVICCVTALFFFSLNASANLYMKGDANGDNAVNALDSIAVKQAIINGETPRFGTDIDYDNIVTSKDAFYLKSALAGATELNDKLGWKGFTVNGRPIDNFTVCVTNPDNANMVFAAETLQKYAGYEGYALTVDKSGTVAEENAFVFVEGDSDVYGNDGFTIDVNSSVVTVTAGAQRGCMYGAMEIVNDYFGYSFYGYYDYELICENTRDLSDGTHDVQIPQVLYRNLCQKGFEGRYVESSIVTNKLSGASIAYELQSAKYGYGIARTWANAHSFEYFISTSRTHCLSDNVLDKNYDGTEEYEMQYGVTNASICFYNMKKLLTERINGGEEIGKSIKEVSCSYAADEKYCTCRKCKKIYNEEESYSAVLIPFVNIIDDALQEEFPGITVITNAYSAVRKGPKDDKYKLNDDVIVLYCWNACSNHDIGSGECSDSPRVTSEFGNELGNNNIEERYFSLWQQCATRFYIWYYPTNIYYMLCPLPNFSKLYNDITWYKSQGVEGFYVPGTAASSFEDMQAYLLCNLMWNNDFTYEDFLRETYEYLKYHYGYGWSYIYEYMMLLEECGDRKGCFLNDYDHPFDMYDKTFFAEHFDEMLTLFEKADELAQNDRERSNIERLSCHMKFLGYSARYEFDYVNGDDETRAEYEQNWRALYEYINSHGIRVTYEKTRITEPFDISKSPMQLVYGINGER